MQELGDLLATILKHIFLEPLTSDAGFRNGFGLALFITFAVGYASRAFLAARGKVTAFFAIQQPSLKPTDSGFQRMNGCLGGVATIVVLSIACSVTFWILFLAMNQ